MTRSRFLTAFLALLLFAQGFSFPNKDADYVEDNPEDYDDETPADSAPSKEKTNTGPVRLISKDATMEVFPGETIILPCETLNADDPVITWSKNGRNSIIFFGTASVDNPDPSRITRTENNSLVIKNAILADSATYVCEVQFSDNNRPVVRYKVLVSDGPQILKMSPSSTVVLRENDSIILGCSISFGEHPASFVWSHGSHKLHSVSKQDNHKSEVHIKHATRHHAGIYQCLADFGSRRDPLHSVINVTVLYSPEVDVLRDYVHGGVGQIANLTCIVHAYPAARVTWSKIEGGVEKEIYRSSHAEIKDGRVVHNLTLKNIEKSQFGKYVCRAENQLGSHTKETELTGTPSRAEFIKFRTKDEDVQTFVLKWQVESYSPIIDYELRYRKSEDRDWITEKPKVTPGEGGTKYIVEHAISNLQPATYEVVLKSQNKFGWSEYSYPKVIEGLYVQAEPSETEKGSATSAQPIVFLTSLLLVVSLFAFENL